MPRVAWSKASGPGEVRFAGPAALHTTGAWTTPGAYVLRLTATDGRAKASSTLTVLVEARLRRGRSPRSRQRATSSAARSGRPG